MATNYKNTVYDYFNNVKDTFPHSTTLTGTIEIAAGSKTAEGAGTLATTELSIDDWVYNTTLNELRRVTGIASDTVFNIDYAFSSAVAALTDLVVVKKNNCDMYKEVSVTIPSGLSAGEIDGKTLPVGIGISFSKSSRGSENSGKSDIVDPIIIDATGTAACVIGIKG